VLDDDAAFRLRVARAGWVIIAVIALLFATLAYWQVFRTDLAASSDNPRVVAAYNDPRRGRVLDRDGNVLVESSPRGERLYHASSLAHVLGYLSPRFGAHGVELAFNDLLSGKEGRSWQAAVDAEFTRDRQTGLDVQLTIDPAIQQAAAEAMAGRPGAVVALDPRNGEVLAMVSYPTFDPATIEVTGDALFADPASPGLSRATQGLYPPGSTFKTVTAAAALEHGLRSPEKLVTCEDEYVIEGFPVSCANVPEGVGTYPFLDAYANSVNAIFAEAGVDLGWPRLLEMARRFGFQAPVPFTLETAASQVLAPDANRSAPLLASTAFGQGQLLATPLQMAVVAAIVANDGVLERPHLGLRALDGSRDAGPLGDRSSRRVLGEGVAADLREMMVAVIDHGHAAGAAIEGVVVAGKTGTAESGRGTSHAWFIGFAPADEPAIAVAVIVEDGGQGGAVAAPVAGDVLRVGLSR